MLTLQGTLEQLGDLHDARVASIRWDARLNDLEFTFEHIYENFKGLADYPGETRGSVALHQVTDLDFAQQAEGQVRQSDILELIFLGKVRKCRIG